MVFSFDAGSLARALLKEVARRASVPASLHPTEEMRRPKTKTDMQLKQDVEAELAWDPRVTTPPRLA